MSEYAELVEFVKAGLISSFYEVPPPGLEQVASRTTPGVDGEGVWRANDGGHPRYYVFMSGMCLRCESESHAFLALSVLEDSQNAEAFRDRFWDPGIAVELHAP